MKRARYVDETPLVRLNEDFSARLRRCSDSGTVLLEIMLDGQVTGRMDLRPIIDEENGTSSGGYAGSA